MRPKVALLGNMNNNHFSLARYLRDRGAEADLLLFDSELSSSRRRRIPMATQGQRGSASSAGEDRSGTASFLVARSTTTSPNTTS